MKKDIKNNKEKNQNKKNTNKKNINNMINKRNSTIIDDSSKKGKLSNKDNIVKLKTPLFPNTGINPKNMIFVIILLLAFFLYVFGRLAYLQFVESEDLKKMAYNQQTINQIISPSRGNIYDSTGKSLAISAEVDTVTINPSKITSSTPEKTLELQELIATGLSEIFTLNYDETLQKVQSENSIETIAKQVENDKIEELKKWMDENSISQSINIDPDTKRYYPYSTIASNVIGFSGTDNQGLAGIEYTWNDVLTGTPGKIMSSQGSDQKEIPNTEETYIPAVNGSDITLTIDITIQSIVEKYLEQAVNTYEAADGGNAIVMDPNSGEILAMASYPNYDLNSPFTPISTLAEQYADESIHKMWTSKSVSDTYEPGSTFKLITSAIALEENLITTDDPSSFYCSGFESFTDIYGSVLKIACWRAEPHGALSLRGALNNSCNPAFMQLGEIITTPTMYKYYEALGLFNSTNSTLYGEQSSIFVAQDSVGPVEQATMSFGQGLNVTPLQMITALSAITNDGILMQPKIVKSITNSDTQTVTEIADKEVRQVFSSETSATIRDLMESVVLEGTGQNAAVTGYTVGGKSGTSEDLLTNSGENFIASFVAISPVENPEVIILLSLYEPSNEKYGHQGGQVAAPTVSQILSEILPYLGIASSETSDSDTSNLITVPDIRNKTITEAEKILKDLGLTYKTYTGDDKNSTLVADQNPKPGSLLLNSSTVVLYGEDNNIATSVTVPDLNGMNASQATNALEQNDLNIQIEGSGLVVIQDYKAGDQIPEGTIVRVTLKETLTDAQ